VSKIICVTGHRPDKLGGYDRSVQVALERLAYTHLKEIAPTGVVTGMALGWDQAVAAACMDLGIPFLAAVPFHGQEGNWPSRSQELYRLYLSYASKIVYVCEGGYAAHKMQTRNEWMVDHTSAVLALHDGTAGGTGNCVVYARSKGKPIKNLWRYYRP